MTDKCTRCGKRFTTVRVMISQNVKTERVKENGVWEPLPNMDVISHEILCEDCFDKYAEIMSQMNYSKKDNLTQEKED